MLLAAIVTASRRQVVCPRAYAWWLPCHPADVPAGRCAEPPDSGIFIPMDATIEIDGLRKRFRSTRALDGMTFTVHPGHVTGFVGPNGAGTSATMRVVLRLDAPESVEFRAEATP
jgi:ABC-type multidrug transport system fused ATPase/permease subunit